MKNLISFWIMFLLFNFIPPQKNIVHGKNIFERREEKAIENQAKNLNALKSIKKKEKMNKQLEEEEKRTFQALPPRDFHEEKR
jgi:hypothetical protein